MSEIDVVHCWDKYKKFVIILKNGICRLRLVCLHRNSNNGQGTCLP